MASLLEAALLERCDGNRNILHACVSMSFPTSAHEPGEVSESQTNGGTTSGALGNKLESIKGAVDALAAAVAAAAAAVRSTGGSLAGECFVQSRDCCFVVALMECVHHYMSIIAIAVLKGFSTRKCLFSSCTNINEIRPNIDTFHGS